MTMKCRLSFGQSIIEVIDHGAEDDPVYLTVSKERYNEDAVQIVVPRRVAKALGLMLQGEEK